MAATNPAESAQWDVRTENETVVVELPPELTLDEETSKQINEQFAEATARSDVTRVLTLLRVENALAAGVFEELKTGADLAASNGIERWAIVVETKIKGMAFESKLDDLQTKVFEDEDAAREWLA
jgi:hypothetical protein